MKGGNKEEEEKQMMDPMFPRLHINDAEKRWPRAPPRNKMGVSEQQKPAISLQNQRFNPELPSISMLPLPPANSTASIPAGPSSTHAGSTEKLFSPFYYPPASSHWTGISHPGIHFAIGEPRNPNVSLNYKCLSVKGPHLPSASECVAFQPAVGLPHLSNSFPAVKLGNGGDFSIPAFHQVGKHLNMQQNVEKEKEKDTFSSSKKTSREPGRDRVKENNLVVPRTRKHRAKEPSTRDKSLINGDSTNSAARTNNSSSEFRDECRVFLENGDGEYEKQKKKRSASVMEDLSWSLQPPGDEKRKSPEERDRGSFKETSDEMNSASAVNLSPDDIVRMLGQKLFWKARRTILHQQRVFVLQIFELHRLIKVQKMVARSPEILFEEISSKKNLLSDNAREPKAGDGASEKTLPVRDDTRKIQKSYPGMPTLTLSPPRDAKPGPNWCFQPPGNQWLVPVRSPSEGLVYKPYSGPCPPPGVIVGCRPLNLRPYGIGIFSSDPPVGQAYYAMPMMNHPSGGSTSALELGPFSRSRASPWEIVPSIRDISSQKSGIVSNGTSDFQGSTGSSPSERDALSLFPVMPTADQTLRINPDAEPRIRVIKVVPHNPNTASESAARIFKSIQHERKQL